MSKILDDDGRLIPSEVIAIYGVRKGNWILDQAKIGYAGIDRALEKWRKETNKRFKTEDKNN